MDVEKISKEDIEFFFNKYKNNSAQIFHLERRLLKESYDFEKWQAMLDANSQLTRKLFVENEELLNEYIRPVIAEPSKLSMEAVNAFALHITFYLFENNIDSLVTEDLINALLSVPEILTEKAKFELNMNLAISKTVTCHNSLEEALNYYEEAMKVYPDFASAPNDDMRIHQVFCLTYKLLAYNLYKSNDYAGIKATYDYLKDLLSQGNKELYSKMWSSPDADYDFHISLLLRFMRINMIFSAGHNDFVCPKENSSENEKVLKIIEGYLLEEYELEKNEGRINPMIYTFYYKLRFIEGDLSQEEYINYLLSIKNNELPFIYPEMAFPDDNDPVDSVFANLLDKMKLFNWSFGYAYILLPEIYKLVDDDVIKKEITREVLSYYEHAPYAAKGFQTDDFIIDMVKTFANSFDGIAEFMNFVQTIFVHREITSSIHFATVSNLFTMCLSHMIDQKPELFVTHDFPTAEDVKENRSKLLRFVKNAGMLHDLGKIGITNLINLHFRRITDFEFNKIKEHTELGAEIAKNVPYLRPYTDLIRGHHKFFNGIGGYPADFDQRKSQYSVYINLLTLCDCLDTATDYKGRNYARKKNFDTILEEFKSDTENRYSKELVELIDQDEGLKEELRYMTSTGRNYTSFETYQKFILPNTKFSEADEKTLIEYDRSYYYVLYDFYKNCYPDDSNEKIVSHVNSLLDGTFSKVFLLVNQKQQVFSVLAGYISYPLGKRENYFMITDLIVRPDCRRHGYGSEIVKKVSDYLAEKDIHHMKINVENDFNLESFVWISGFAKTKEYLMDKKN